MTKKRKIELINAIIDNTRAVAIAVKDDEEMYRNLIGELSGLQRAYLILTDDKYAKEMEDVYLSE